MRKIGKKGSEKYYIIISMILGLIVLGLALYFIFQEFFNEDELDIEKCRQSIILANLNPDLSAETGTDFKDKFPPKCKTQVIEIDTAEKEEVYKIIADTVLSCWYMYGEDKFDSVHTEFWGNVNYALVCARITFSDKALAEYDASTRKVPLKMADGSLNSAILVPENEYTKPPTFYDYYTETKAPNSDKTYNEILPFIPSEVGKGYLLRNTGIWPQENDLLIAYTKIKLVGIGKAWYTKPVVWAANIVAPYVDKVPMTPENIKLLETPHMNIFDSESFQDYSKITDENNVPLRILSIPA